MGVRDNMIGGAVKAKDQSNLHNIFLSTISLNNLHNNFSSLSSSNLSNYTNLPLQDLHSTVAILKKTGELIKVPERTKIITYFS